MRSIGLILLGIWAIMDGGTRAGIFHNLNATFLGTWLLITGIVIIIEYLTGFELPKFNRFHRNPTV